MSFTVLSKGVWLKKERCRNLKVIFSLLFFEQGYLGNHTTYQDEVFSICSSYSPLGKRVSDFLVMPYFVFYIIKR